MQILGWQNQPRLHRHHAIAISPFFWITVSSRNAGPPGFLTLRPQSETRFFRDIQAARTAQAQKPANGSSTNFSKQHSSGFANFCRWI